MLNKKDLVNLEGLFMLYAVKTNSGKVMAAKTMNTSIDTLNKYLELLERELGAKLISVNDRRCTLTSYGEKVFTCAEQIINSLQQTYNLKENEKSLSGEVRIACDRGIKKSLSSSNLECFFDTYSDISFSIDVFDSLDELNYNNYDLYLSNKLPKDNNFIILYSKENPYDFFASSAYLDSHPHPKNLEDILLHHRLIMKRDYFNEFKNNIRPLPATKELFCLSNSNLIVYDIVKSGGGIGLLPLILTQKDASLIRLENINYNLQTKSYLFTRREIKDIPRVRVVIDYYKSLLEAV